MNNKIVEYEVFAIAATAMVLATPAWAATWYVSGDGNDSNTGMDESAPFLSGDAVYAASSYGDKIYVLASSNPVDDGMTLKDGQKLIGKGEHPGDNPAALPGDGLYSVVSNSAGIKREGHAVFCESACTVEKMWLDNMQRSAVYAFDGGAGDVDVRESRISGHNKSIGYLFGNFGGYAGVTYLRGADGKLDVEDTVIESGDGNGVTTATFGSAVVDVRLRNLTIRNLDAETSFWADGINAYTLHASVQTLSMGGSRIHNLIGPAWGYFSRAHDSSKMHLTVEDNEFLNIDGVGIHTRSLGDSEYSSVIRNNTICNLGFGNTGTVLQAFGNSENNSVIAENTMHSMDQGVFAIGEDHAKIDAVVKNNTLTFNRVGVHYAFFIPTSGTPDVQRVVIDGNTVEARHGIVYNAAHRGALPGETSDVVDELIIRHNHLTQIGEFGPADEGADGMLLRNRPEGNELSTWLVEDNTIAPFPGTVESVNGITIVDFALDTGGPQAANVTNVLIRRNKITIPFGRGIDYVSAIGGELDDLFEPPYEPAMNMTVTMERNCIQSTESGLAVTDRSGWGFGNLLLDLGSGVNDGRNNFIDITYDIAFFPPNELEVGGSPLSVPGNQVLARNNWWGVDGPGVMDFNGLLGTAGFADLPDTSDPRPDGPNGCGIDDDDD